MKASEFITEIKKGQKDANGYTRCWPGRHAEGTKQGKNGGQVRNCVPNEGEELNEYIVRSGDDISSVFSLNLFADLLGQGNLSDYDEEFANSPKWQAVVAKWAPKAEYLQREIAKYQSTGRKLRDAEADALDATAYDGSDAYENADTAAKYLPKVYNKQAIAIVRLLKDGYAQPSADMHEDSVATQQQWIQSMKQQHPGVTFAQNKTTMQIFAMVPGKGKVGTFDPRQQVNELEVADLVRPGAQTSAPPRRAYSIALQGKPGRDWMADKGWAALNRVFPQDYPADSNAAEYKVVEVSKRGSAIVKTGIASEDIAETYVSKLSAFVPEQFWRIVGGGLNEELEEEFDLIESIIEGLAEHNGVDSEVIWEDLESLDDDELYVFATTTTIMETISESRGGNYEQMGYRKSNKDKFALLDRTLDSVILTTNDFAEAKKEAIEWAEYDDIRTEVIQQDIGKRVFVVDGYAGAEKYLDESEAWQKANNRDRTNGMSRKAVKAYRREHPGSKLQTAVTTKPSKLKRGSKASKRRKSYCSRSRGQMKMHNISCAKTPDKAICKARRRWNC